MVLIQKLVAKIGDKSYTKLYKYRFKKHTDLKLLNNLEKQTFKEEMGSLFSLLNTAMHPQENFQSMNQSCQQTDRLGLKHCCITNRQQ